MRKRAPRRMKGISPTNSLSNTRKLGVVVTARTWHQGTLVQKWLVGVLRSSRLKILLESFVVPVACDHRLPSLLRMKLSSVDQPPSQETQ